MCRTELKILDGWVYINNTRVCKASMWNSFQEGVQKKIREVDGFWVDDDKQVFRLKYNAHANRLSFQPLDEDLESSYDNVDVRVKPEDLAKFSSWFRRSLQEIKAEMESANAKR